MPGYNILLTMEAIYDITDITEYIDIRFGYANYAIHKKPFPPSIIFYIIKESQKEIHILRILRNECDWKTSRKSAIINQIKPKGAIYHGKDH